MAQIYDNNDMYWSARGDFVINHDGDLADCHGDPLRSIYQEIRTRLASDLGEWSLHPGIGASIGDFVGEPNNKVTAEAIKVRIRSALTRDGLVNSRDLKIQYAPIEEDQIMFRLSLSVAPTFANAGSNTLGMNIIYNYSENNIYCEKF
jgi:hypothetical protein